MSANGPKQTFGPAAAAHSGRFRGGLFWAIMFLARSASTRFNETQARVDGLATQLTRGTATWRATTCIICAVIRS